MRNLTILFHTIDTTLYQLVSCYLNLQGFRVVASMKPKDILQKIDRQKFGLILIGSESEVFLDQFLFAVSQKDNMNRATPLVLLNDKAHSIQIESAMASSIKAIVDLPFTLAEVHTALIVALASSKK